jgi:integrase
MPTLKLTQAAVDKLKPPATGRVEYWDSQLPGFGLRVSDTGRKTWQALYRVDGKMVREKLGTLAQIESVADARARARQSMTKARAGAHPVEERRRKHEEDRRHDEAETARKQNTLAAAIDRYLVERPRDKSRRPMRREYLVETARTLEKNVKPKLGARPISEVTSDDVKRLVRGIAKDAPSQANHTLTYLKAMLGWAVGEGLIEKNPAIGVAMPALKSERDRALDDDEIRLFWLACDKLGWPFGSLFKLLLLTGQRRGEVAQATWSEIGDLEKGIWTLAGRRTKNGRPHIVHLSPLAVEILEGLPRLASAKGYVFMTGRAGAEVPVNGFTIAPRRLRVAMIELRKAEFGEAAAPIEHFTLHDLRRSAATGMASIGIAPHVVDKILNHVGGKISGIAAIYNRFEYLPERKVALEAWARHIENLVRPSSPNVVQIPRRA